ncbi:hypothetical protein [Paludisphaera soli]|uniref:hypothetical protein n=1 Tax=Paludisphaera soli TaxID=2712865 RepID=UPI0013ED0D54|nr:hypothetical protein [Paludisphaera soli]
MNTHAATPAPGGWIEAVKRLYCRMFARPEAVEACVRKPIPEEELPNTTDAMVDESSEESFPASDPPSFTGTTSFT